LKYYIATKLENHAEHNRIRDLLNARGHECTYDWTHHGPVHSRGLDVVQEVAIAEAKGVIESDVVIVLWPGGRGTHVELGVALGRQIPVILWTEVEGHRVASPETCAFYHHPLVRLVKNQAEFEAAFAAEFALAGGPPHRPQIDELLSAAGTPPTHPAGVR
jgi:nucleoside 2-deoxyribosyltransferase